MALTRLMENPSTLMIALSLSLLHRYCSFPHITTQRLQATLYHPHPIIYVFNLDFQRYFFPLVNPWCTCSPRVTVVGSVWVSVKSHLTYRAFVRPENVVTHSVGSEGQKFMGICLKWLATKHKQKSQYANYSNLPGRLPPLDTEWSARGYPMIVNNIQPYPERCLLMPLALVGVRTDSTMHYS